ncbi:MAG: exosortase A [Acidiferrobacterales bacterium]
MFNRSIILNPANIVLLLITAALILYQSTAATLVQLWTGGNAKYSHGLLLLGLCLVIFWKRWVRILDDLSLQPHVLGICLLVITSLVWFLAQIAHVQIVQQLSLVFLVGFLVWALLGYQAVKSLAFPILLMLFAVPIWDSLNIYLQHATARAVVRLLDWTGVPAALEGLFILVPAGTFEVAEYCSGLGQLVAALTLAFLYAYVRQVGPRLGLLCAAAAALVSFLTNTIRIYVVVLVGQSTSMQHPLLNDHDTLGWVLFGAGIGLLALVGSKYLTAARPHATRLEDEKPAASSPAQGARHPRLMLIQGALFGLCGMAIGPVLAQLYVPDIGDDISIDLVLPSRIGPWYTESSRRETYRPSFHGADVFREKLYRNTQGETVYVYVAYYHRQEQGKEAVHQQNQVYDKPHWTPVASKSLTYQRLPPSNGVAETIIRAENGKEKIVWRWYYVDGKRTGSDYLAKAFDIWATMTNSRGITVFVIATDLEQTYGDAAGTLRRFLADSIETLEAAIDGLEKS